MYNYDGIKGRNNAINDIYSSICNHENKNFLLIGKHGNGKKYILKNILKKLQDNSDFSILRFAGDQIIEEGKNYSSIQRELSLSLSIYVGVSWTNTEKNNNKMNYLLNCLRKVKSSHIVFCIADVEEALSEVKDILLILLQEKHFIEQQLSKKITILVSACKRMLFENFNVDIISLPCYTLTDIKEYIEEVLKYRNNSEKNDTKYLKLYEICHSDLSLVNILYRDLLENNLDFSISLNNLVCQKLNILKKIGANENISSKDMEEIILTCSLSAEYFSRFVISQATERSEEIVNDSFQISVQEKLFQQINKNQFDFVSPIIKQTLENIMLQKHNTRLLDYYNYLSKYRTDEYYLRAYYLIRFYEEIDENTFDLLILAVEQSYMFHDIWLEEKIYKLLDKYGNDDLLKQYQHIILAYKHHKAQMYEESIAELLAVDNTNIGKLGQIEFFRLKFKNYYLMSNDEKCKNMLSELNYIIQQERFSLKPQEGLILVEETIYKLKFIYDISPYILDGNNDYKFFQELYDCTRCILKEVSTKNIRAKSIQYITNVFNRKAFLFANPMAAMPYYEAAKTFFYKNNIWNEYCITLVCQAGTCLACHQYEQAVKLCEETYQRLQEYQITIPKREKLDNNYKIAQFLKLEADNTDQLLLVQKAKQIANELEDMAIGPACGTKHVLLTNAASLYLYSNELEKYKLIKRKIEHSIGCLDVSDIRNSNVNDFYRYHFAWFELFYHMQHQEWTNCETIMGELEGFIPALFKKQENLWQEKNSAALALINNRKVVTGYEFSVCLVKTKHREIELSQFYHRGLMLSDIQYTSYS